MVDKWKPAPIVLDIHPHILMSLKIDSHIKTRQTREDVFIYLACREKPTCIIGK